MKFINPLLQKLYDYLQNKIKTKWPLSHDHCPFTTLSLGGLCRLTLALWNCVELWLMVEACSATKPPFQERRNDKRRGIGRHFRPWHTCSVCMMSWLSGASLSRVHDALAQASAPHQLRGYHRSITAVQKVTEGGQKSSNSSLIGSWESVWDKQDHASNKKKKKKKRGGEF